MHALNKKDHLKNGRISVLFINFFACIELTNIFIMSDILEIERLAWNLRRAIEKTEFTTPPMNCFPYGCCGKATIFLSEYLVEHGYNTKYYCGLCFLEEDQNPESHAWVVLDNEIIADITGDQYKHRDVFLNYNLPVYVGIMDDFHKLFLTQEVFHKGGIDSYDEYTRKIYRIEYNRIKDNLII